MKVISAGEETFALHCQAYGLTPEREYFFHLTRRFRFDFAWPDQKIAVEIEGLTRDGGRHQRRAGYTGDCMKYNLAVMMGWQVLRYTPEMVKAGTAIDQVRGLLASANKGMIAVG